MGRQLNILGVLTTHRLGSVHCDGEKLDRPIAQIASSHIRQITSDRIEYVPQQDSVGETNIQVQGTQRSFSATFAAHFDDA